MYAAGVMSPRGMAEEEDYYIIITSVHLRETLAGGGSAIEGGIMASLLECGQRYRSIVGLQVWLLILFRKNEEDGDDGGARAYRTIVLGRGVGAVCGEWT